MISLKYHPVWDLLLSSKEKESYSNALLTMGFQQEEFYVSPIRMKRKKNNGLVATVFLVNNTEQPIDITDMNIEVINSNKKVLAAQDFTENLTIFSKSALPWSFVFNPASILEESFTPSTVQITLSSTK